mmetsp:Transcript_48623/g.121740  ORF Transcript_48623/g.121740 Transcript_48623/m.121740 type:complete len:240 (+) Transcript_48623:121-840(+)
MSEKRAYGIFAYGPTYPTQARRQTDRQRGRAVLSFHSLALACLVCLFPSANRSVNQWTSCRSVCVGVRPCGVTWDRLLAQSATNTNTTTTTTTTTDWLSACVIVLSGVGVGSPVCWSVHTHTGGVGEGKQPPGHIHTICISFKRSVLSGWLHLSTSLPTDSSFFPSSIHPFGGHSLVILCNCGLHPSAGWLRQSIHSFVSAFIHALIDTYVVGLCGPTYTQHSIGSTCSFRSHLCSSLC